MQTKTQVLVTMVFIIFKNTVIYNNVILFLIKFDLVRQKFIDFMIVFGSIYLYISMYKRKNCNITRWKCGLFFIRNLIKSYGESERD